MVIEMQTYFRRLACIAALVVAGTLCLCGVAGAQSPPAVTTGSVIPIQHPLYGQVYRFVYWKGYILALDTSNSALYQMSPGSTTFTTIYTGTNTTPMGKASSYWTEDMTIDNEGNLYLGQRYGTPPMFWRVPFSTSDKTWHLSVNNAWGPTIQDNNGTNLVGQGSSTLAFLDSGNGDGSGTLYWQTEVAPNAIYKETVDGSGNPSGPAQLIVSGLLVNDGKLAVDANGNLYFVESPGCSGSSCRVPGVLVIPAGTTGLTTGEASLTNLIPPSYTATNKFNGVSLDAAGNMYLTSASDSYGGTFNGEFMIPNSCGNSQADVTNPATCYDWNNASYISPVGSNNPLMVDPRGFLWIPEYQDWSFPGSGVYGGADQGTTCEGACNFVVWALGQDNLGASAVGTASATGTVFVNFNKPETLSSIGFAQPGSGSDFATTATNPYPNSAAATPTQACATAGATPYQAQTTCPVWVTMTPRTVGNVSGKLALTDSNGAISGSAAYLGGVGQGPMAALMGIAGQTAMATGLSTPAQVAVDTQGNVYVADPGLGKVLMFAAGSSGVAGTAIGTGLNKPTGVAVDGAGDVYIGDSGKIFEIPFVNGALNTAGQMTLFTTGQVKSDNAPNFNKLLLGNHLNLAVDALGDVFVADADNQQVVEIGNTLTGPMQNGYTVVASGFTAPSAVAVDNSGDIFAADGANLYEINPWSWQAPLTTPLDSSLSGVTGLAVEPSGSVIVAQANGILRIPSLGGTLTPADAVVIDAVQTAPQGVAIDNQGNLYVSDMTGGTPNLFDLNTTTNAAYAFGQIGAYIPYELDVSVYNVGNEALSMTADPTFGGTDSGDFSLTQPSLSQCDTSGVTTTEAGFSCAFGLQLDAFGTGARSGSMSITSSAANGSLTANFTATSLLTLEPTAATLSLSPTATAFPGSTVATVTITQAPVNGNSPTTNVPDGAVTVTVTSAVRGSTQPPIVFKGQASGTATSTTATIPLSGLPGGKYNVKAQYRGNANYGGAAATTTLTVSQALPKMSAGTPTGIQPDQFNQVYYVGQGSTSTVSVAVTSALSPQPTGTITFMNGNAVADPTQGKNGAEPIVGGAPVSFSLSNLPVGTYSLTAVYSGDSNYAADTSAPITFQIVSSNGAVLITGNPTAVSTAPGTPVSSTLTLESLVAFSAAGQGSINITCDNATLPRYSECTFNNPQPQLCPPVQAGGASACGFPSVTTSVVTISTNIPVNVGMLNTDSSPFALAGIFGLGLLGLGLRKRRLISRGLFNLVCLGVLLGGAVFGFTGCTNSGYTHTPPAPHYVTPAGTYNVTIMVTDAGSNTQDSLPFTLPVTIK